VVGSLLLLGLIASIAFFILIEVPKEHQAARRSEQVSCEDSLKQIGLAFRTWCIDHDQKFPFNLPARAGGSLEYCNRDSNGIDANSLQHFLVISNELYSPHILACPGLYTLEWTNIVQTNISYHLHTARQGESSSGILAYCPKHHIALYVDGSVSWDYKSEAALEAEAAASDAKAIEAEAKKAQQKAQEQTRDKEELDRDLVRIEARYPDLERDWTFKTGAKRKAKFVRLDGSGAWLDFSDGQSGVFLVPLQNLSSFDQAVARAAAAATR
jgi:hypothetical protein